MNRYEEDASVGKKYRENFRDGLIGWIRKKQDEAKTLREKNFSSLFPGKRESLRGQLTELFGFPLTEYANLPQKISLTKLKVAELYGCTVYRMQIEVVPGVPFYGLYFAPVDRENDKVPLVVACHGGSGSPEVVSGFVMDSANYNHMVERALKYRVAVFAPQLYMWHQEIYSVPYDRQRAADWFVQLGGSITAFEILCIRRSVDALLATENYLNGKQGIVGLSYGGMYAIAVAACDTRFQSVYSSCWLNDRVEYNWSDWCYRGAANSFFDAEMAALVSPRALFAEVAEDDPTFAPKGADSVVGRLQTYYQVGGGALKCRIFKGVHELAKDEEGFRFLMQHLGATKIK